MASNMLKIPSFVMGTTANIEAALEEDGYLYSITTVMYAYCTDTGKLAFIHPSDKVMNYIVGNNKTTVQRYDTLPSVSEGDEDVLYIVDDVVYSFNGTEYVPTYQNLPDLVSALTDRVDAVESDLTNNYVTNDALDEKLAEVVGDTEEQTVVEYVANQVTEAKEYTDEQIALIEI